MSESLRVSTNLNIMPPECAGYGLSAVNWIRDILRKYTTSLEEHSECQALTRGEEQTNTLIRNTLEFITGTLTHAGFFGSDTDQLNKMLLSDDEFKIIMEKYFHTMSNTWSVLKSQERNKGILRNKHHAMETKSASLATEINNAISMNHLSALEVKQRVQTI